MVSSPSREVAQAAYVHCAGNRTSVPSLCAIVTAWTAAIGVEKQGSVAAMNQPMAVADKPYRAISQIVRLPALFRYGATAEQSRGNLAVARLCRMPVERAERQKQAVAARGRQGRSARPRSEAGERAPESERGLRANLKQAIKRKERRGQTDRLRPQRDAKALAVKGDDESACCVDIEQFQLRCRKRIEWIGPVRRSVLYPDRRRERPGRPRHLLR